MSSESSDSPDDNATIETILKDFIKDLLITFPEHSDTLQVYLSSPEKIQELKDYCKTTYPERFFDILYQNNDIFSNADINTAFLPNIDFKKLWECNISDKTRETIWKYLQLILFNIVQNVDNNTPFGDTAKLFEAINSNELHDKIEETIKGMQDIFEEGMNSTDETNDSSEKDEMNKEDPMNGQSFDAMPDPSKIDLDPEKIQSHLSGLLNGKIGSLAKEIAEEAAKDLNLSEDENPENVMKNLFKNPGKIMGLVKSIGGKLDAKMKSGDLNESELLEEASEIVDKMKDMPGLKEMMSKMGMNPGNGKFDFNAMKNAMQNNMKNAKMRERMRKKLKEKQALVPVNKVSNELKPVGENEYTFQSGDAAEKSHKSDAPDYKGPNKKKKKRRKKKDKVS